MSKSKYTSSSGWEDSIYGGHYNVIWDYPYIPEPNNVDLVLTKTHFKEIQEYTKRRIFKIFLCTAYDTIGEYYKSVFQNLRNYKIEKKTKPILYGLKDEYYLELTLNSLSVYELFHKLQTEKSELYHLFEHFKDVIVNSTICFKIPVKKNTSDNIESIGNEEMLSITAELSKASGKFSKENVSSTWGSVNTVTDPMLKQKTKFFNMPKDTSTIMVSQDVEKISTDLLRKLDIDLDPKSDKISSLRNGKLETQKIASALAGDDKIYFRIEEDVTTRPFKVCILMDESGSMDGEGISTQRSIVNILYNTFSKIMSSKDIFVYGHSGYNNYEYPEIRIYNDDQNPDSYWQTIQYQGRVNESYNENYDGPVIEKIYERLRTITQDNILFIAVSDGCPSGKNYGGKYAEDELKQVIEKCKRDGFVTVGIGVKHYTGVDRIYNYNCTISYGINDLTKKFVPLINRVVKTEFQT